MPTSSFNKDFTITSKKAIDSIIEAFEECSYNKRKNTFSLSEDDIKRGEEKLKKILLNK